MQTCLEKKGIEARHESLVRNDYNLNDEYTSTHPNALSDGDPKGKGTGHGGHTYSVPDCNRPTSIDYSNFDTENGGGLYDIEGRNGNGGRNFLITINNYNKENPYGANLVDTTLNVSDGQIRI
jgi:hypothetical protein